MSLPEVPLLGVLPGTGGLTRVTDKRKVRHDHADLFCTSVEGVRGQRAVDWRLVDEVGIPHKQVEFDLVYGQGIPKAGVLLDMALKHGVIKQSGAWFATDQGEQVGQGRVKSIANLTANPVLYESVRADVQKALDAA